MTKVKNSIFNVSFSCGKNEYIYNSLSGALIKTDCSLFEIIDDANARQSFVDKEIKLLMRKGFLVNDVIDEMGVLYQKTQKVIYSDNPDNISYTVVLTNKCNCKCKYCFEQESAGRIDIDTDKTLEFIFRELRKNPNLKTMNITWFGGEPLLNINAIETISDKLLPYLDERKVRYEATIITNGIMLNKLSCEFYKKYQIRHIQVTLDGTQNVYSEYKGVSAERFSTVLNNLEQIGNMSERPSIGIRLNCDKHNVESLFELTDMLLIKGFDKFCSFYPAQIYTGSDSDLSDREFFNFRMRYIRFLMEHGVIDNLSKYLPKSRIGSCGYIQRGSYTIDSDGTLKKCERNVGDANCVIGNVSNGLYYNDVERDFQRNDVLDQCMNCSIYPICRGGCKKMRMDGKSIDCSLAREELIEIRISTENHLK